MNKNYKYLFDGWTELTTHDEKVKIKQYATFKHSLANTYPIHIKSFHVDTLIEEYRDSGYNLFFIIWTIEKLIEYDKINDLLDISPFIKRGLTPDELHEIGLTFFKSLDI